MPLNDCPSAPAADAHDGAEQADVALVFVHGIGQQYKGRTLLEWAEPLAERLDRQTREVGGSGLTVEMAQTDGEQQGPIMLRIDRPAAADGTRRVLVSEAR